MHFSTISAEPNPPATSRAPLTTKKIANEDPEKMLVSIDALRLMQLCEKQVQSPWSAEQKKTLSQLELLRQGAVINSFNAWKWIVYNTLLMCAEMVKSSGTQQKWGHTITLAECYITLTNGVVAIDHHLSRTNDHHFFETGKREIALVDSVLQKIHLTTPFSL